MGVNSGGGLLGSILFVPPTAIIDLHILLLLPPIICCCRRRRNNFDDDTSCSSPALLSETSNEALDTVVAVERTRHMYDATCMSFILLWLWVLYLFYLQMMNYFMRQIIW